MKRFVKHSGAASAEVGVVYEDATKMLGQCGQDATVRQPGGGPGQWTESLTHQKGRTTAQIVKVDAVRADFQGSA